MSSHPSQGALPDDGEGSLALQAGLIALLAVLSGLLAVGAVVGDRTLALGAVLCCLPLAQLARSVRRIRAARREVTRLLVRKWEARDQATYQLMLGAARPMSESR